MSICAMNNFMNTGRRYESVYSYFRFAQLCYAGRYFAASYLSDRCVDPSLF